MMTKISVNQLSSNLWFGIIVFKLCIIISIRLGEFQRVDKTVHFKEVLEIREFFTKLNTTERLFVWSGFPISLVVMAGNTLQLLRVTAVMESQGPKETQLVVVYFSLVAIAVTRQIGTTTSGMPLDLGYEKGDISDCVHHPFGVGASLAYPF